jgi:hypothetical protein
LLLKRLRRAAVIEVIPWNSSIEPEPKVSAAPKKPRDPLKLARYYQSLLHSGQFENRAALGPPSQRQPGKGDAGVAETSVKTKKRSIEHLIADLIQHIAYLTWLLDRFVRMALVIT